MRDFSYTINLDNRRVAVEMLYLDENEQWEVYLYSPIENYLQYRSDNGFEDATLYEEDVRNAERCYHDEEWSICFNEFWDLMQDEERNLVLKGQGDEVYDAFMHPYEFFKDSDEGYFAMADYIMDWLRFNFRWK